MYSQTKFHMIGFLFSFVMLFATNSYAATATWSISGNLVQISQELLPYFSIDDAITGSMTVEERAGCEATSGGISTRASFCDHKNAVSSLSVTVGTHSFNSANPINNGRIQIINNATSVAISGDAFILRFASPTSNTTDFGTVEYNNINMHFVDSAGSALSSTALTLAPPDASLFNLAEFMLTFIHVTPIEGSNQFQITSSTASASNLRFNLISAVPEPESYAMLLAGLGLIGFTIRKRRLNT